MLTPKWSKIKASYMFMPRSEEFHPTYPEKKRPKTTQHTMRVARPGKHLVKPQLALLH